MHGFRVQASIFPYYFLHKKGFVIVKAEGSLVGYGGKLRGSSTVDKDMWGGTQTVFSSAIARMHGMHGCIFCYY
jgi:hypothetical protein